MKLMRQAGLGLRSAVIPGAIILAVAAGIAAQGPVSGAIFTTNLDGTFVNGNVYDDRMEPYLNGGPRANAKSCTSAGLPDGDYYFQVTDPPGSTLLSSDSLAERTVTVAGGLITVYPGTHGTGTGRCGDTTVQLAPYELTPNAGGEYKVWLTPVAAYNPLGGGSFGFLAASSKTDNFKVASPVDSDGDGIPDTDDNCPTVYDPSNNCYGG